MAKRIVETKTFTVKLDIRSIREAAYDLIVNQGLTAESARGVLFDLTKKGIESAIEVVTAEKGQTDALFLSGREPLAAPTRGSTAPAPRRARARRSA